MLEVEWRPRAHLDRESIAIYLGVERHNPEAALRAIRTIDAAIEMACRFPDAGGHYSNDRLDREYRTTLAGSYTIYYRFNASTLTVCRVLHQRQDISTYSFVEF